MRGRDISHALESINLEINATEIHGMGWIGSDWISLASIRTSLSGLS